AVSQRAIHFVLHMIEGIEHNPFFSKGDLKGLESGLGVPLWRVTRDFECDFVGHISWLASQESTAPVLRPLPVRVAQPSFPRAVGRTPVLPAASALSSRARIRRAMSRLHYE